MRISVLLADDQHLVRAGLRGLLERTEDIEVVGESSTGVRAVADARRLQPQIVLMDVRMPHLDGIEATRQIVADDVLVGTRVIVLTTFELDEYVFAALQAGASGFLTKDVTPSDLRRAIRAVAAGDALLTPSVTRRVIGQFAGRAGGSPHDVARLSVLTDREREVLELVATGLSNDEIGRRLFMSPLTAKTHVSRAIGKLGVRDRVQLVVFAYQSGLVSP